MNTQKALLELSTNLNTDIKLKALSLAWLKADLAELVSLSSAQKSLEPWISQLKTYSSPTTNMMKFDVAEAEKPTLDERWEFLFSLKDQQKPEEVYGRSLGAMGEIIHLVVYRLWKIRNITVVKFSPKLTQVIDSLQSDWNEDTTLFLYK